ncbi:Tudor/PWWP/MBT superfamily protein [Euphorbia peplus]|nr:Tudor/PWWP/MBT superfamily protein [Euphorbia peplus]
MEADDEIHKEALADNPSISPAKENGARVSLNGNEDFVSADDAMGGNNGGLEDSDMNGVSSLLKMHESKSSLVLGGSVLDKDEKMDIENTEGVSLVADVCGDIHSSDDTKERKNFDSSSPDKVLDGNDEENYCDSKDEQVDNSGDEDEDEHDFTVGDFVWGKIRSHPWWPGRIYDPVYASDYAKKVQQGDKILVAYFGDGTFAWCNPSQLKPLDDNFLEMSNQSSSKHFAIALENAMDEIGRLVDLKMTCSCVPKDNLIGFGRTLVVNAGIKEGLLIPEGGIDKFSSVLFEPTELLTQLKEAAEVTTATGMLEFTVLKSWLSAFYRSKGGHELPSYYDPKPVPGLEDKSKDWTDDYNGVEVRNQGPEEEYWISSPRGRKYGQSAQNPLHKCQGVAVDGHYQRRKRKSLAEILDAQTEENTSQVSGGEKPSKQAVPSTKRKKRNSTGESANDEGNEVSGGGKLSNQATSSSARRKTRKSVGESADNEGKVEANDGEKLDMSTSTPKGTRGKSVKNDNEGKHKMADAAVSDSRKTRTSSGRKKMKGSDEADNKGASDMLSESDGSGVKKSSTRGRKKKNSNVTDDKGGGQNEDEADNKGASDMLSESDANGVKKSSVSHPSARGRKKRKSNVIDDNGAGEGEEMKENSNSAEKLDESTSKEGKTKELLREDSMPRERKRSKYLSPPYTNIAKGLSKKEIEAESMKAASQLNESPRVQLSGDQSQNQLFKETDAVHGSDSSGGQTPNQDNIIDPLLVNATANEVLTKIRSAALNPLYVKDTNSLDTVGPFFSAFRSSSYCSESNGEYTEPPPGRKRKSQKSEPGPSAMEQTQSKIDNSSLDSKSPRKKVGKSEEAKLNEPEEIREATPTPTPTPGKKSNGEAPRASLFVSFGPGSSLPSKNDLIKIYGKFGPLNKQDTEMFYTNYCARVVFLNSSAAEEAFNASQLSSPFGAANVTFRLRYLAAETKTRKLRDIKPSSSSMEIGKSQGMQHAPQSSDSNISDLNFIKQKLETVTSLIETSEGKISDDMKSTLEGEMKVLLEKVSKMAS